MVVFDALVAGHLRRRGIRAFATILAIAFGVAVYLALRLADARAVAAFDARTGAFGDEADFSVVPRSGGTLDARLLARVRAIDTVASAVPAVEGDAVVAGEVVHVSGRDLLAPLPRTEEFRAVLPGPFAPIGTGPDPFELIDGRGAFFSAAFAERHRLRIGDDVPARVGSLPFAFRLRALVPRTAILDANTAIVDLATAQALFERSGRLDRIDVVVRAGDRAIARAAVVALLPVDATVIAAGERRAAVRRMAAGYAFDLALLGDLALLAALVLSCDAVGVSVVQRRAEIGTLRVLGATRFAIARAFLIEGALYGTVGGLFGVVAGTALGDLGSSIAAGTDALVYDPGAPFVALFAGTLLGACGAAAPALAAASLPPDRALRNRPGPMGTPRTSGVAAAATGVGGAVACGIAVTWRSYATPAATFACAAFVVAIALGLPWIVDRAMRAISGSIRNVAPPVRLAIANVCGNPRRIALAVGALGASVALATAALVLAASLDAAVVAWAARAFPEDIVVTPREGANAASAARFPAALAARIARLPQVALVRTSRTIDMTFRDGPARVANDGPPQRPLRHVFDASIDATLAARTGLRGGDAFALPIAGGTLPIRVVRIDDAATLGGAGTIAIDPRTFARAYRDDTSDTIEIRLRPEANTVRTIANVRRSLEPRAVDVQTSGDLRRRLIARFAPVLHATFAIAALALGMGGLGLSTALAALALERRDDIRLLRVSGLTRGGVRAMIVYEAASLGAFGGLIGIAAGIVLAAVAVAVDRVAFGWSIGLGVPFASVTLLFLATILLAAIAGLVPARIASRLDLGRALRTSIALVSLVALAFPSPASARAPEGNERGTRTSDVWRIAGRIRSRDGSKFDVAATFFRYTLSASNDANVPSRAFDAAALSFVDEDARSTTTGVRVDREGSGLARVAVRELDLRVDDWRVRADARGTAPRVRIHVAENDVAFDGTLVPIGSPVPVAPPVAGAAPACATCLGPGYAFARLAATGSVRIGTTRTPVRGTFWIDRESTEGIGTRADFVWRFTIELDDGRTIFLRAVRRRAGAGIRVTGFFRSAAGTVTYLAPRDVRVTNAVGTTWRDVRDVAYPSLFEAILPSLRLDFALVPVVQAQEIDTGGRGLAFYDGALDVERAHPGPRDSGFGYVELTGYAGPIRPSP